MQILTIVIVTIHLVHASTAANILAWMPTPSYSHQIIIKTILQELIQQGHTVTYLTPTILNFTANDSKENLKIIDLSTDYKLRQRFKLSKPKFQLGQTSLIMEFAKFTEDVVSSQFENEEVNQLLKNGRFDLVIVEGALYPSLVGLGYHFNCPTVSISSLPTPLAGSVMVGDTLNPSYETNFFLPFSQPDGFLHRILSVFHYYWYLNAVKNTQFPMHDKIVAKYLKKGIPKVCDMKVDLLLANEHPVLTGARLTSENVIQIGGILEEAVKASEDISNDLVDFIQSSEDPCIYFSLGSNVKSSLLPAKTIRKFINAFARLPYKVLWKFETDNIPENASKNILFRKWFPQRAVLNHPNVKLFIFQGGLQSLEEAIHARTPMIGVPFFGDQLWNTDRVHRLGIGERVNLMKLTEDELVDLIHQIIGDEKYINRVNEIAEIFEDQPISPLKKAVYWIEFVLRHKNMDLFQNPAKDVPVYQYYLLDMILLVVLSFLAGCLIIIMIVKVTVKLGRVLLRKCGYREVKNENKKKQ